MTADERGLHRALKAANEAHRKALTRRNQMRAASMLVDAEVHSTYADLLCAEAALHEAQDAEAAP